MSASNRSIEAIVAESGAKSLPEPLTYCKDLTSYKDLNVLIDQLTAVLMTFGWRERDISIRIESDRIEIVKARYTP